MRTIAEIKESITQEFMQNEDAAKIWGFAKGASWNSVMGRMSVENVIIHIVAVCCHVVESLMATHKKEVETMISVKVPHSSRWYCEKTLSFLDGEELIEDSDEYDLSQMTQEDIEAKRIVKYAVAVESENDGSNELMIKVAGEDSEGNKRPLTDEEATRLKAYLGEIKDAGVKINLVNEEPDQLRLHLIIYYNALYNVEELKTQCEVALKQYVENLDFDGVWSRNGIVDAVRGIEGVELAQIVSVVWGGADHSVSFDKIYSRPRSGYCKLTEVNLTMQVYGTDL